MLWNIFGRSHALQEYFSQGIALSVCTYSQKHTDPALLHHSHSGSHIFMNTHSKSCASAPDGNKFLLFCCCEQCFPSNVAQQEGHFWEEKWVLLCVAQFPFPFQTFRVHKAEDTTWWMCYVGVGMLSFVISYLARTLKPWSQQHLIQTPNPHFCMKYYMFRAGLIKVCN